jgi:hypothetical protein
VKDKEEKIVVGTFKIKEKAEEDDADNNINRQ